MDIVYTPAKTGYQHWMEQEGIPIVEGLAIEDVTALALRPWKRLLLQGPQRWESLSQDQKGMLAAFEMMPIGTPIFGPPGIPEDRLQFLRQAFIKVMDREDFRRELEKESGVWDEPLNGEEATERVQTLMKDRSIYQKLHGLVQNHMA